MTTDTSASETGTKATEPIRLTVDGKDVTVSQPHPHLLSALREELGVTSLKDGCSPSGQCGCCTVLVDGKAVVSCTVGLEKAAGKTITTLSGVSKEERERFAKVFAQTGALQCGFCTPGILVRVKALLDKNGAGLTREKASTHLGAHLCRCTGYTKILDAVEILARGDEGQVPQATAMGRFVGDRGKKYEGESLSLGDRGYVDDIRIDGMLHGAVVLTEHARAEINSIDTSEAEKEPGVVRVFTAKDVPGRLKSGLIHKDWPCFIPEGGKTSFLGDVLAFVVADSRLAAREAVKLVKVDYNVLTPFATVEAAMADGAEDGVWGLDGNILSRSYYKRGEVEEELANSAFTVEETFQTQRVEHAFLEPESTLAVPKDDGTMHVYSGGQGVWDDRDNICAILDVPKDKVTVELVTNGGGFGGKEDMINQGQTALAAWLLKKPVKCTLSRKESLLMHDKRHPIRMAYQVGCDKDGKLTAVKAYMTGDSGPYASVGMKVLERAAGHATGPYYTKAAEVEAYAVRTNNSVGGAFRGFGANQSQFAMEGCMDRLAEQVGISKYEIRRRNVIQPGQEWGPGQIMSAGAGGAQACLEAVKDDVEQLEAEGFAVGLGLGMKNSGLGNGFFEETKAVVRFRDDDKVEVRHGWTEMGQGVHTVALQVAAGELDIDPDRIEVYVDTTRELGFGQTTGSRGTVMAAASIKDACDKAKADGCQPNKDYEGYYVIDWTQSFESGVKNPTIHSTFSYACQVMAINKETGKVEKVVAAHDVGKAVNPMLCEGQIEGSVHMGLGFALTEEFPTDDNCKPVFDTLRQLDIIRPKDMPPVKVILVEVPDPDSPYGVKGVGEIGLVPTAGAVAGAMNARDGKWRTRLPLLKHNDE